MGNDMKGRCDGELEIQGWLVRVLRHMFKEVGAVFDEDEVRKPDWYLKHTWTKRQEEDFAVWLRKTLKKQHPWKYRPEKLLKQDIDFFILNYGWKVKEEDDGYAT